MGRLLRFARSSSAGTRQSRCSAQGAWYMGDYPKKRREEIATLDSRASGGAIDDGRLVNSERKKFWPRSRRQSSWCESRFRPNMLCALTGSRRLRSQLDKTSTMLGMTRVRERTPLAFTAINKMTCPSLSSSPPRLGKRGFHFVARFQFFSVCAKNSRVRRIAFSRAWGCSPTVAPRRSGLLRLRTFGR